MYPFNRFRKPAPPTASHVRLEPLEGRQLLSASPAHGWPGGHGGGPGGTPAGDTIAFSLTPAAVQTGLTALATADGLTDPTATTPVALGNQAGVETYTVSIASTGTVSRLTVDAAGDPVTADTHATTTFAALASTPAAEITAIASAKDLTAPTAATVVNVTTTAAGVVTYSVDLATTATATTATTTTTTTATAADETAGDGSTGNAPAVTVSVDAAGDPVGNQQLPFSVFSTTVQDALNAAAPTGATALTATSTVDVRTAGTLTTYSARFTVGTTDTTVTVDDTGATVTPASQTTVDFSTLPTAVQQELQTLATGDGYADTIAADQTVTVYTEVGGTTTLYAVTLSVTTATTSRTHDATFVTDAGGNPTVLPRGQGGPADGGPGRGPGGPGGGRRGGGDDSGNPSGSDGSTTTTTTGTVASAKLLGRGGRGGHGPAGAFAAALAADPATPTLGPALGLFATVATNTTVAGDLTQLTTDAATLRSTVRALSTADAATLKADQKAVATAVKAIAATLAPDRKTLRTDAATDAATLRADQSAVRKAHGDATALAAADATLATDESTAFAALAADLASLRSLISDDAGVTAAVAKLATDLPTVAAAAATVRSDYDTLQADIGSALSTDA